MQLLYILPPGTRKQESGSYVKLIRLISLRNTHHHLPSAALAFLRTPAALAGADISCGSIPVLLSLYSLPASSFYILAFLSFRILFFQHFLCPPPGTKGARK